MGNGKGKTLVPISEKRLNGIRRIADQEHRTITTQLDLILAKAGVPLVGDDGKEVPDQ